MTCPRDFEACGSESKTKALSPSSTFSHSRELKKGSHKSHVALRNHWKAGETAKLIKRLPHKHVDLT